LDLPGRPCITCELLHPVVAQGQHLHGGALLRRTSAPSVPPVPSPRNARPSRLESVRLVLLERSLGQFVGDPAERSGAPLVPRLLLPAQSPGHAPHARRADPGPLDPPHDAGAAARPRPPLRPFPPAVPQPTPRSPPL